MNIDIKNMKITKPIKHTPKERIYNPKIISIISGDFIKGPIPLNWINKTFSLHKRTILTVLSVWHLFELKRRPIEFKYSYSMASKFGLKRTSAWRGLSDLEGLNLISVKRIKGGSPLISILIKNQSEDG
jgi:hypothetical protein